MKKIIKCLSLFILSICSLFLTEISNVKAETNLVKTDVPGVFVYRHGNGVKAFSGQFHTYDIDGKVTYCIEPGTDILDTKYVGYEGLSNSPFSPELTYKLQLIGYYGYSYPGHNTVRYRMATQALIWNAINGQTVEFWTEKSGGGDIIRVTKEQNDIMALVNAHYNKPSFENETKTTSINTQVVFEDTNNILSEYEIAFSNGADSHIDGNKLYVTPTTVGEIRVAVTRKTYTKEPSYIYLGENPETQKMAYFGIYDPIYVNVKVISNGGSVEITKTDNSNNKLSNVKFGVYNSANSQVCTITTNSNGFGTCTNLPLGTYTIKELETIEGYVKKDTIYTFELTKDKTKASFTIENEKIKGYIEIYKVDADNNSSAVQGEASLKGAKYGIYSKGIKVGELITDEHGYAKSELLEYGEYIVREETPSTGYLIDGNSYNVKIEINNEVKTITSKEQVKKGYIEIYKTDADNNSCTPQGDALLSGATYGIFDSKGVKVDELEINSNCYARSKLLPYGNYTVKELKANKGYKLDPTTYNADINDNAITIKITSKEEVFKFNFNLFKVKSDGTTGEIESEANAEFDIYLISKNQKIGTIKTNEKGTASIKLPYGRYNVCQVKGADDSQDAQCFEINIVDKDIDKIINNGLISARIKVVKVDSKTNEILPIAGIKFKIRDLKTNQYVCQTISYPNKTEICVFETNEEGILYTPYPLQAGEYQLEELDQVIDGYLWNPNPLKFEITKDSDFYYDEDLGIILEVKFANEEVLGKLTIHKTGEQIVYENGNFHYEEIPLAKIKFGLYDLNNNLLATTITNDNGYAEFNNLKLGKYYIKEIATNDEYVLDDNVYNFELKYIDQYTPIVEKDFTLKNYLKKGKLEFSKKDFSTSEPLPNTLIEIYTINDELVFSGKTDENGKIIIDELKIGKYYIAEKEAPVGYLLNDIKMYFEIKENGEVVKTTMKDEIIKGSLEFTKEDFSTSEPLPNTLIEIYDENDNLIFSGKTDENGKIIIDELKYGKYYIIEKQAPEGYVLNSEKMYFEIRENGEVVKTTMKDEIIKGSLEFTKEDFSTSKPLPNTLIEIYDENDNLIFSGKTDENGKIIINELKYGKYYIIEKQAPEGYVLNNEKMYFKIKENGEVVKATMKDEKITSKVGLHKIDENGNPLAGVVIGLYDINDNLLETFVTNENGDIEIELEYGSYYFKEISTLDGYTLNEEKVYFDVNSNGDYIQKTLVNEIIEIEVPRTSANDSTIIDIIAIIGIALGIGFLVYDKKRKK